MIEVWKLNRRPPDWVEHPSGDPRLEVLPDLVDGLVAVLNFASGHTADDPLLSPLDLISCLRDAADRIEFWTDFAAPLD